MPWILERRSDRLRGSRCHPLRGGDGDRKLRGRGRCWRVGPLRRGRPEHRELRRWRRRREQRSGWRGNRLRRLWWRQGVSPHDLWPARILVWALRAIWIMVLILDSPTGWGAVRLGRLRHIPLPGKEKTRSFKGLIPSTAWILRHTFPWHGPPAERRMSEGTPSRSPPK